MSKPTKEDIEMALEPFVWNPEFRRKVAEELSGKFNFLLKETPKVTVDSTVGNYIEPVKPKTSVAVLLDGTDVMRTLKDLYDLPEDVEFAEPLLQSLHIRLRSSEFSVAGGTVLSRKPHPYKRRHPLIDPRPGDEILMKDGTVICVWEHFLYAGGSSVKYRVRVKTGDGPCDYAYKPPCQGDGREYGGREDGGIMELTTIAQFRQLVEGATVQRQAGGCVRV